MANSKKKTTQKTAQNGQVVTFQTTKVGCRKTSTGRHSVEVEMLVGYNYPALKAEDLAKVSQLYSNYLSGDPTLASALAEEGVACTPQDIADAFAGRERGRSGLMTNLRIPVSARSWHSPHHDPKKHGEGVVVHNTNGSEYRCGVIISEKVLKADPNGNKPRKPTSKNPVILVKKVIEDMLELKSSRIRTYKV